MTSEKSPEQHLTSQPYLMKQPSHSSVDLYDNPSGRSSEYQQENEKILENELDSKDFGKFCLECGSCCVNVLQVCCCACIICQCLNS